MRYVHLGDLIHHGKSKHGPTVHPISKQMVPMSSIFKCASDGMDPVSFTKGSDFGFFGVLCCLAPDLTLVTPSFLQRHGWCKGRTRGQGGRARRAARAAVSAICAEQADAELCAWPPVVALAVASVLARGCAQAVESGTVRAQ